MKKQPSISLANRLYAKNKLIEDKLTEYPVLIPESFFKDNYVYDSLKLLDIPYIIIKKTLYIKLIN